MTCSTAAVWIFMDVLPVCVKPAALPAAVFPLGWPSGSPPQTVGDAYLGQNGCRALSKTYTERKGSLSAKLYYVILQSIIFSSIQISELQYMHLPNFKLIAVLAADRENLLETVGGSRRPEEPLSLAVVCSVQRVDVVCSVCP